MSVIEVPGAPRGPFLSESDPGDNLLNAVDETFYLWGRGGLNGSLVAFVIMFGGPLD